MTDFYALAESQKATPAQAQFMDSSRSREALFDCERDPLNLDNLVESPAHQEILNELREALSAELLASSDLGLVPELELRRQTVGTTPLEVSLSGKFDIPRLLEAADLVGNNDFDAISKAIADSDPCVRYWGAVACMAANSLPQPVVDQFRQAFRDPSDAVRIEAAGAIAKQLGDDDAYATLLEIIHGDDETTILHAARTLEVLASPRVHDEIQALADRFADSPGDVAWCIRFTTSAYLQRVASGDTDSVQKR
jgi:hypothetical protein